MRTGSGFFWYEVRALTGCLTTAYCKSTQSKQPKVVLHLITESEAFKEAAHFAQQLVGQVLSFFVVFFTA